MDSRLIKYYNDELLFLSDMGKEFAREFPKIAGRLSLEEFPCPDPYVERLLEGFAFLAARVHLKLDAEYPRFTQSILQTVFPHYLSPTPSMCVVQFQPEMSEPALADGYPIPRQETAIKSLLGRGERTACEYRTAHDVTLYPLVIEEAQYCTRELQSLDLPQNIPQLGRGGAKAGIRIRLRCPQDKPLSALKLDKLPLFIRGTNEIQSRLYEQIIGHSKAVVIQGTSKPVRWREVIPVTANSGVKRMGFDDEEALLPFGSRSFQGYRLLQEYFTFPQRFNFFELNGLAAGLARCKESVVDVIILMDQVELRLEGGVEPANFVPFCTPAINLFPKRCDRIHVTDRFAEFHVVPDRTRPLDFEVYDVKAVTGYGESNSQETPFKPFYCARDFDMDDLGAYFNANRVPRTESDKEQRLGRRSKYAGSEVYLSLVDAKAAPYSLALRQLAVESLCTNRDLPIFLPLGRGDTDFTHESGGPIESIRVVSGPPTTPKASQAEGQTAWRLVSHLSLNYLSLVDSERGQGAAGIRDLLSLYGDLADPIVRKQIDGLKSVTSVPITRRVPSKGPITFARGLEETILLDEAAFEGVGAFLLGAVLERFFAKYVSINSFTETVVKTMERGEIMRWPARLGRRHVI